MTAVAKLSNLQLELLKIYKYSISDVQLQEIKLILAQYFAKTASDEMDRLWDENGWTNETMKNWSNEHLRTPYNAD
jgi:hypothetical protein